MIWNDIKLKFFEKPASEPVKGGDKYKCKLELWKKYIKTRCSI